MTNFWLNWIIINEVFNWVELNAEHWLVNNWNIFITVESIIALIRIDSAAWKWSVTMAIYWNRMAEESTEGKRFRSGASLKCWETATVGLNLRETISQPRPVSMHPMRIHHSDWTWWMALIDGMDGSMDRFVIISHGCHTLAKSPCWYVGNNTQSHFVTFISIRIYYSF